MGGPDLIRDKRSTGRERAASFVASEKVNILVPLSRKIMIG